MWYARQPTNKGLGLGAVSNFISITVLSVGFGPLPDSTPICEDHPTCVAHDVARVVGNYNGFPEFTIKFYGVTDSTRIVDFGARIQTLSAAKEVTGPAEREGLNQSGCSQRFATVQECGYKQVIIGQHRHVIVSRFLVLSKMLKCLRVKGSDGGDAETSVQEPHVDVMELVLCPYDLGMSMAVIPLFLTVQPCSGRCPARVFDWTTRFRVTEWAHRSGGISTAGGSSLLVGRVRHYSIFGSS